MKDKIYEPARHNETAPAEGMAAVNTHMPEEEPLENLIADQQLPSEGNTSGERLAEPAERKGAKE